MIAAERTVSAPPERVFEFLSDLRNHWRLEHHFAELAHVDADGDGGRVRMKGPLGLRRTARTRVEEAVPYERLRGRAEVGRGTVGRVAWDIRGAGEQSQVRLSAEVERASAVDRVLLALGGRAYLRRLLHGALESLERELSRVPDAPPSRSGARGSG